MALKCQDLLKALNGYIDEDLDPSICAEFEAHMQGCNKCQVVVDSLKKTIKLYQDGKEVPLPSKFQECLQDKVRSAWQKRFKEND